MIERQRQTKRHGKTEEPEKFDRGVILKPERQRGKGGEQNCPDGPEGAGDAFGHKPGKGNPQRPAQRVPYCVIL